MKENIRNFNNFANTLANKARNISLKYFKKIEIRNKLNNGFDPVTYADTKQKDLNKLI